MTTTTVNITFPGGEEEYTTIHATEPTIAEHTEHGAVNVDGGEIIFDGHLDNMLDIKKTLGNTQKYKLLLKQQ